MMQAAEPAAVLRQAAANTSDSSKKLRDTTETLPEMDEECIYYKAVIELIGENVSQAFL